MVSLKAFLPRGVLREMHFVVTEGYSMQRRRFVRVLIAAGLAPKFLFAQQSGTPAPPPPAPVPWTLGLNPLTPLTHTETVEAVAEADLSFFSAEQMATLTRLSELLVPAIGTRPGAIAAGTPAFLDFLIGESPAERKKLYTAGLDWLNAESRRKHGKPFTEISGAQADAMVKPWMRTWMTDHPPTELHADFLNIAHADIRVATMNSKAWSQASTNAEQDPSGLGLYWSPIDPDVYAVGFDRVHVRPSPPVSAPKASHMAPSYPR